MVISWEVLRHGENVGPPVRTGDPWYSGENPLTPEKRWLASEPILNFEFLMMNNRDSATDMREANLPFKNSKFKIQNFFISCGAAG